ncbi:AfsR/SARP family transcriptional regulator [Actinoplanes flavus]|uniref:Winged helix-turn-helix domain-containing protein n=1 Tax=Actinoplanes flavus TaxID=2820290 RepID=A0ABS3UFS6_9ACTN|nr:winged helix-turn-helix domain-containing protein [Actinoplanes flavus]MBO3737609.1 winged helix-turn-helix domain-containing protein [Actinoplanes flavus]
MIDGSSAGTLRFELLGPVRAFRGDDPVDLGPLVQRAVLAVLLLHADRPVPVQEIVAALWNGDPPENGVDVVQRCIGGLRRALDPGRTSLLTFTNEGYVLRVGENTLDTGLFRAALEQARAEHRTGDIGTGTDEIRRHLNLWQGEPMAGLTGRVFDSARARLKEERATASELLAVPAGDEPSRPAPAEPPPPPPPPPPPAPTRIEPPRPQPPAPTSVEPPRPQPPAPTRIEPPRGADPAYPEAVDPWEGHDLLPPHSI